MTNDTNNLKPVVTQFLEPSSSLHDLYNKVCRLKRFQEIIGNCLPDALSSHIQISSYRNNTLHLMIDNAHWATRLRYIEQDMTKKLKSIDEFRHITRVQYSIRPRYTPPPYNKTAQAISNENAKHIASVAKYIEDEPLRKALFKLSKAKPPID